MKKLSAESVEEEERSNKDWSWMRRLERESKVQDDYRYVLKRLICQEKTDGRQRHCHIRTGTRNRDAGRLGIRQQHRQSKQT